MSADDLFHSSTPTAPGYDASDIEVLEGLEPVRKRPGMYVGGRDQRAYHHLFREVFDNAMDEAVAGHASRIDVTLIDEKTISIEDNGRGIPIDPHPKFPEQSALQVIMTTLHSGGKFNAKAYKTSGGLHGVGISVVNALSSSSIVEVARNKMLHRLGFSRGHAIGALEALGAVSNRRGTKVTFTPDQEIFGDKLHFSPSDLYSFIKQKAYLNAGVTVRWNNESSLTGDVPSEDVLNFPGGLVDWLDDIIEGQSLAGHRPFAGRVANEADGSSLEWAFAWIDMGQDFSSFCNTIPTPQGGTHVSGLRSGLTKGFKSYAQMRGNTKFSQVTQDDVHNCLHGAISIFIPDPEFQGQTKDKLNSAGAQKFVDGKIKDHIEHWLAADPEKSDLLLQFLIERAEERLARKQLKEVSRKTATRKLRLPGKLADCSRDSRDGTELFIVEGDSAGGTAKQARDRMTQAILPIRGKILNVASATEDKIRANKEIGDLLIALGCQTGNAYREEDLRYDKVIIMTDADVDGAHIASLLMTFFFRKMPQLIEQGHLYLALPPLYKLSTNRKTIYVQDDAAREKALKEEFPANAKVDISRFKGLGEMMAAQLKETAMNRQNRKLIQVGLHDDHLANAQEMVETLMGKKAESRFQYISTHAPDVQALDL